MDERKEKEKIKNSNKEYRNLSGYLSPEGDFYYCPDDRSFKTLGLVILNTVFNIAYASINEITPTLLRKGWIICTKFSIQSLGNISSKQISFLINSYDKDKNYYRINSYQAEDINNIIADSANL